jgi:hypothetical protein
MSRWRSPGHGPACRCTRVDTDDAAQRQVEVLPVQALAAYMELRTLLEVGRWSG